MAKAGIVYAGTDNGLVIFSDPGGSGRWRRVAHTLPGQVIHSIYARNALDILVATAESGVQHSSDGGQSWHALADDAATLVTGHALAPDTLYMVTTQRSVQRSDDNAKTWQALLTPDSLSMPIDLLVDPHDALRLWLAAGTTIHTSQDRGATWAASGANLPGDIASLVASPGRANLLFAVVDGRLFRVHMDTTVQAIDQIDIDLLRGGSKYTVVPAVLAGKQETLLAALSTADRTMLVYEDADASWHMARVDRPIQAAVTVITPASYHIDTAWAGTATGQLLRSHDRGSSWEQIAEESTAIRDLAVVRLM